MAELELIQRRFERERAARKAAESLLEQKSRELYEANQQLAKLAEQTKAIFDTAAEGIIAYDMHGTIHAFNASATRIFQVDQAIGKNIRTFFAQGESSDDALFPNCPTDASHDHSMEGETCNLAAVELVGKRKNTTFPAEAATSRNTCGNTTLFTMLLRDLTVRKKLEARLSQAQKMESVGQLAAGIAHEINTPIQFVGDNIKFLEESFGSLARLIDSYDQLANAVRNGKPTDALLANVKEEIEAADVRFLREECPTAIRQSLDGIQRVAKIVRALKDFSQPSNDQRTSVDINQAIENTLTVLANQIRDIATVEAELDWNLQPVVCLPGQINQCLLNIITNAIEAMEDHCSPKNGKLRIATRAHDDSVVISFDDNGPGIPNEIIGRIFEPFFSTKEVGRGTGQGLSFVYDVVVGKHGGTIQAQSSPGNGTTIVVTIPILHSSTRQRQSNAYSVD
jgi:two-component system, NtrC family, sensor kinase